METDQELANAGNRMAFGTLVERYQSVLFGYCFHLTRSLEEAEELAREVCVQGFFAAVPADAPYDWMAKMTQLAIDIHRGGRGRKKPGAGQEARPAPGGKLPLATLVAISEEIHSIEANTRIAMTLKHSRGLTADEISEITGESATAVSSRLSRGFKTFRDKLIQRMREGGISVGV